jgi:hypothetical protein
MYIRSSIQELKCSRAVKTRAPIVDIVSPKRFILKLNNVKTCRSFAYLLQGALAMMEFMKKRRVVITRDDMTMLLLNDDMNTPPEIHSFSSGAAKQLHEIGRRSVLRTRMF